MEPLFDNFPHFLSERAISAKVWRLQFAATKFQSDTSVHLHFNKLLAVRIRSVQQSPGKEATLQLCFDPPNRAQFDFPERSIKLNSICTFGGVFSIRRPTPFNFIFHHVVQAVRLVSLMGDGLP
jgi:hypothetical protein